MWGVVKPFGTLLGPGAAFTEPVLCSGSSNRFCARLIGDFVRSLCKQSLCIVHRDPPKDPCWTRSCNNKSCAGPNEETLHRTLYWGDCSQSFCAVPVSRPEKLRWTVCAYFVKRSCAKSCMVPSGLLLSFHGAGARLQVNF